MARLEPASATVAAPWAATSGTALAAITKATTQPTAPAETPSIEATGTPGSPVPVEVKPEIPSALKSALEAGKKMLTLKAWVYLKIGNNKNTETGLYKLAEQYTGSTSTQTGAEGQWVSAALSSAQAEAINTLAKLEELTCRVYAVSGKGGKRNVYEVYFEATWEEGATTAVLPLAGASSTSSGVLAVTAIAKVPLGEAASSSAASLAVTAKTMVTLASSSSTSTAQLSVTAATTVSLGAASSVSSASLTLTAIATVTLASASSASVAQLTVQAAALLSFSALSESSATIVLLVPAVAVLALETASSSSAAQLTVTAATHALLAPAAAESAASLELKTIVVLPFAEASSSSTAQLTVVARLVGTGGRVVLTDSKAQGSVSISDAAAARVIVSIVI